MPAIIVLLLAWDFQFWKSCFQHAQTRPVLRSEIDPWWTGWASLYQCWQ